ncbi:MAG: cytochrome P450 [bacterium]
MTATDRPLAPRSPDASDPERPAREAPSWHGFDLSRRDTPIYADPFPAIHRLRAVAPVHETPIGSWRLSRHADCVRLLRELRVGVRRRDGSLPRRSEAQGPGEFMLQQDPPSHTRLRKLVSRAFTPRAVESWRPRVRAIVAEQLDQAFEGGGIDVIADLALPVPATLICELLGVPVADRDRFTVWTADATHGLLGDQAAPEIQQRAIAAATALAGYFSELIEDRRRHLTDDLLSVLIRAEEEGDRLTQTELVVQSIGLLIAGFETTIGLIGNGAAAFARHPEAGHALRERPELVSNAVEECLRFDGPIGMTPRVLHEDAEIGGRSIPADSEVFAILWGANRDPEVFAEPDRFDVARPNARLHLAFGGGTHLCLGAHLARMEAQEALGALVLRASQLELEDDRIEWGPSLFRVPARLPLRLR